MTGTARRPTAVRLSPAQAASAPARDERGEQQLAACVFPASHVVWRAAGCPVPCDTAGQPIAARHAATPGPCAACNDPGGCYDLGSLISASFLPTRNANRLSTYETRRQCAGDVLAMAALDALGAGPDHSDPAD